MRGELRLCGGVEAGARFGVSVVHRRFDAFSSRHDAVGRLGPAQVGDVRPHVAQKIILCRHDGVPECGRLGLHQLDFVDGLDIDVKVEDLRFTGSLANYNWSKYSDIDLHLVVDFSEIDEDIELVKSFFDAARMRWNDIHDIKIYGYEVEIYVENVGDVHKSSGIYSIMNNKWVVEPDPTVVEIDIPLARKKSDSIATQINILQHVLDKGKYESVLKSVERIKEKIRRMRRAGLDSPKQEFSPENIAFKILRREETLQKLNDLKYDAYDQLMSVK